MAEIQQQLPHSNQHMNTGNVIQIEVPDFDPDVTSTVFESKDESTQMTKQSFTIIYFITYKKTIHFKLICKNVHSCRQYFSKHMDTVQ